MNAVDAIRHEARDSYEWLERIVSDVSPEQAGWSPPGSANSIAVNYAHIVVNTDVDVTRYFHGKTPLLEAGGWIERLGLNPRKLDDMDATIGLDWTLLHEYGLLVQQQIQEQADALTQADLDRSFQMIPESLGIWKGYDIYALHIGRHVWMHGGEIACIKGLQGLRGYRG